VSWPKDVRESDWGKTGNKKLHSWAFDRLYQYLEYKGEMRGVEVLKERERVEHLENVFTVWRRHEIEPRRTWPVRLLVVRVGSQRGL